MTTPVNLLNPAIVNAPAAEAIDQPDAHAAASAADNHPAPA